MYYVYSKSMISCTEEFVGVFADHADAIARITMCYDIDRDHKASKGCYYYFMKKH